MHAAGIGWLTACLAALAQALLGQPPFEMSGWTALLVVGLAVWAAVAARTFAALVRTQAWRIA